MADRQVLPSNTFEEFRQTFNSTAVDVGDIANILNATGVIANATDVVEAVVALNSNVTDGNFTNITVTGGIGTDNATYAPTANSTDWDLQITTRDAGTIETITIDRTIDTDSTTSSYSIFSQ